MSFARRYIDSFPARTGRRVYWFFARKPITVLGIAILWFLFVFIEALVLPTNSVSQVILTILVVPSAVGLACAIVYLVNHPTGLSEQQRL